MPRKPKQSKERKKPYVTITHNDVQPPKYTPEEIEGLKQEEIRLAQHINILEEEVRSKRDQLIGISKLIQKETKK